MKRRELLKNLGFGVTAGLMLPAWLSSCSDDEEGPEVEYDGIVGIVGAGAAGLAVADYLIAKGIKVKIFEASGRAGGRIESIRQSNPVFNDLAADFHVELGADRIFGVDSEFGNILKLAKVPITKFREAPTNAEDYYIINNEYFTQDEAEMRSDFLALKDFRETGLASYTGGGSVQTAAATTPEMQGILNSWLGNAYGSTADQIGANAMGEALNLISDLHGHEEIMLVANPISDVITSRYDKAIKKVSLNRAVKAVNYTGDAINLTILNTKDGGETTEVVTKLVVTSPVTVLKNSSLLSFSPALPASKTDALSRIGMDPSMRVIIEFTTNEFFFKEDDGNLPAFIYGGTVCPSYFFCGAGRSERNRTVAITINGPKAQEFSDILGDLPVTGQYDPAKVQLVLDEILAEMDVVFDGQASDNIRKRFPEDGGTIISVIKDWTRVPYIQGAQSYPKVGGTNEDRVELAAPVENRIFFAGEATDFTGEFGTISGAIKSGERAAEELVAVILEENGAS